MTSDYWNRKHFAEYVAHCLAEREIHPWYMAYYCESSDSTFRKYMKGAGLPSPIKLIMLAELFECSVNDLLGYGYYEVSHRDHLFDSGQDTRKVEDYFAEQLVSRMRDLGCTTSELAVQIELNPITVNEYIKYGKLPDTWILIRIAEALKCTPSDLLGY